MKTSELFRRAGQRIERGESSHICYAITGTLAPNRVKNKAKNIVIQRLSPHHTYTGWIASNHPKLWNATDATASRLDVRQQKAREGRVNWCKALAEEFEAKGD